MLTTESPGGLRSRPMTTLSTDEDGDLWFFVSLRSDVAMEVSQNPHVNLAYSEPDEKKFVSITGRAMIVLDADRKKALWNPMARAWFGGPEDPDLGLIKVSVREAEYWDGVTNQMVSLFEPAMAGVH